MKQRNTVIEMGVCDLKRSTKWNRHSVHVPSSGRMVYIIGCKGVLHQVFLGSQSK